MASRFLEQLAAEERQQRKKLTQTDTGRQAASAPAPRSGKAGQSRETAKPSLTKANITVSGGTDWDKMAADLRQTMEAGRQKRQAAAVPPLSLPGIAASSPTVKTPEKKTVKQSNGQTVDFRGVPLAYSPDGVTSGLGERTRAGTFGGKSGTKPPVSGTDGTISRYRQGFQGGRTPGGPDWGELAKQTALAGVGQVSKAASSTLSAAEQLVTRPMGYVFGNPDLYRDGFFYRNNQDVDQVNAQIQEKLGAAAGKTGTAGRLIAEYGPATIAALPQAGLAWLTAGKSLAAQTSTAGLQAASAAAQGSGVAATVMNGFRQLAGNPSFQYSFLNTVGGDFEQALSDGADVPTAYAYAALTSLANGMVEVGGGIDTLPEKDKPFLLEWVKSMFDEGKEEVVQGAISQTMQNAAYGKKNPVFSTTDENAIINPGRMAKDFAGGAVVGGILGGGQIAINKAIDTGVKNAELRRDADLWNAQQDVRQAQERQAAPEGAQIPGVQAAVQNGPQTAPEGIKNAAPVGTEGASTELGADAPLVAKIRSAIPQIQTMRAVAEVTGTELPQGGKMVDRLVGFVNKIGNKVNRPGFGDVLFSRGRIKSSMVGHGASQAKIETFAAVPAVIQNGVQIDFQENWKGRKYNTFTFAAPVVYKGEQTYLGVIVTQDPQDSRYYVHEVVDADGTVLFGETESQDLPADRPKFQNGKADTVVNPVTGNSISQTVPAVNSGTDTNVYANSGSAVMMLGRLVRMGERGETAARLGDLLGRVMDGKPLTAGEWNEINSNPNAARLGPVAQELAARNQTGGQNDAGQERTARVIGPEAQRPLGHSPAGERLLDGRADRGAGADSGRQAGAVPESAAQRAAAGGQEGYRQADGQTQSPVEDRRSGRQNLKAIERQEAVTASGAQMVSTREYMGLGSDRPCLFEAPEEVIRSDRVLSEVYDDIWEMGYRPHLFTGTPEMADSNFSFNGAVSGENVFIRIDHSRYDADAIWDHEKFHILSAEDPGLRSSVRDMVLEKYGEDGLREQLEIYLDRYRGAYGMENAQGVTELSDGELDMILEELLADAYAGKDSYSAGVPAYRDTVREIASQREDQGHMTRGPPEATRFDIGYDANNRPFVTVEEDILDGVHQKDWVRTVKDNLRKKFPNGVTVGNSEIQINAVSRKELTGSRSAKKYQARYPQLYADKMRATNSLDEILRASRNYVNEAPLHPRTDNFTDFGRGTVQLRVGGNDYIADVVVGYTTGGKMVMYDIVNMQETSISGKKTPGAEFADQPHKAGRSVDSSTPAKIAAPASGSSTLPHSAPEVKPLAQNERGNVVYNVGDIAERSSPTIDGSSAKGGAQKGGKASLEATLPHSAPEVKPLELMDSRDYSKAGTSPAEITGDSDVPGLRLPEVNQSGESVDNTRFSAEDDRRKDSAVQRKSAVKKLADDLAGIFPETQKSYLRDLADEIRAGASQDHLEALFNDTYDSAKVYDESPEAQELREIAHELRGRRVYVDQSVREEFGDDWIATRQFFFGKGVYFTNDSADMGLDQLNAEMASRFGGRFHENETDMSGVISRMEYILRGAADRQTGLDEQARQYGGEEAARQFREAYRQRFMDAAEGYKDTINGIDEAQRAAREAERRNRRQELEDYLSQARKTLRDRAAQGMDTGKIDAGTHVPEGMDIDRYVESLQQRAAAAKEERMKTVLREDFRGSEAMNRLGIRITGTVTEDYQNAGEIRKRSAAAEQARRAVRLAEKRLNATEAEKQFAAGITAGYYTEQDIPHTMNTGKIMELANYYMGERAFGFDLLKQRKADISRAQQDKAKAIFGPALEASEGKPRLVKGAISRVLGDGFMLNNRTAERNMRSIFGDEAGEQINQWLFAPVAENEGERYRFVNRMMDQVREIEDKNGKKKALTKSESALAQKVLEGRAAEEAVASAEMSEAIRSAAEKLNSGGEMQDIAREFRLNEGNRRLARQAGLCMTHCIRRTVWG